MQWFHYIILLTIIIQAAIPLLVYRNYRFNLQKYKRKRTTFRPFAALCIPCKGLEPAFEKNIASFFKQDYEKYILRFVVEEKSDPAYKILCRLKENLSPVSKALDIKILVAGVGKSGDCSQKNHNLLYCIKQIPDDVQVLAFADSDICVSKDWLSYLVYPLRQPTNGVASGYRWFVPKHNKLTELVLSSLNAKVAQLLGNTRFNQVWGGSMAIRAKDFKKLNIAELWAKSISDDLSLSRAVKKNKMKVAFVPACLAPSYENTTWPKLFEFARRQFLITRVNAFKTWLTALLASLFSITTPIAAAGAACLSLKNKDQYAQLLIIVPFILLAAQLTQAILREAMIAKILEKDRKDIKTARIFDIIFFWPLSFLFFFLVLSSAFGKTITWQGIKYKLAGPTNVTVIKNKP